MAFRENAGKIMTGIVLGAIGLVMLIISLFFLGAAVAGTMFLLFAIASALLIWKQQQWYLAAIALVLIVQIVLVVNPGKECDTKIYLSPSVGGSAPFIWGNIRSCECLGFKTSMRDPVGGGLHTRCVGKVAEVHCYSYWYSANASSSGNGLSEEIPCT